MDEKENKVYNFSKVLKSNEKKLIFLIYSKFQIYQSFLNGVLVSLFVDFEKLK